MVQSSLTVSLSLSKTIDIMSDGSIRFMPVLPEPVERPDGFVVGPEHNGRMARIRHDRTPRAPDKITNEIEVMRQQREDGLKIDPNSKITWGLGVNKSWVAELDRLNGVWVADRLKTESVGWFDTGFPVFSALDCGGNLVVVKPDGFQYPGWAAIYYQRYQDGPKQIDWHRCPHLVTKQVLTNCKVDPPRILTNPNYLDAFLPKVSPVQPYHSLIENDKQHGLVFFPDLPLDTTLCGIPVRIEQYCFWGSNTYGEINGFWYLLEEMLLNGKQDDRRTYCPALAYMPCPPPLYGETRQG